MQWIQDELKLVEGGEGREGVMQLFEKAVKDYLGKLFHAKFINFLSWLCTFDFIYSNFQTELG